MFRRLNDLERRWRAYYNVAPVDDETWRRARIYNAWFDHAILRGLLDQRGGNRAGRLAVEPPDEGAAETAEGAGAPDRHQPAGRGGRGP
jgi:hypothetical protein